MSNWLLYLIIGILAIIVGGIAVANPQIAGLSVSLLLAIGLIVFGVMAFILGFSAPTGAGKFWSVLLGIVMVITGIAMVRNPLQGVVTIEVIVSVLMVISGVIMIMAAFGPDMGFSLFWAIIGGIASFVLAYFLITNPNMLGILVGLQLIFDGVGMMAFAFASRRVSSIYY